MFAIRGFVLIRHLCCAVRLRQASGALLLAMLTTASIAAPAFSDAQICKATIAGVMGKNPAIIRVDSATADVILLSYDRPNDHSHWAYKCKVQGVKVIWGNPTGRWMDNPADSRITYALEGAKLVISETFSDGSGSKYPYDRGAL